MYSGTNKTALKSQKRIVNAMIELMLLDNYENITIKNICKKANISRQRFYFLFNSKEEIAEYYLNDFFKEMEKLISDKENISLYDNIFNYFSAIDSNDNIKKFMQVTSIMPIFEQKILDIMSKIHIIKTNRAVNKSDFYANRFLYSGLNGIFLFWLEKNREIPLKDLVAIIENILQGKVFE